MIAKLHSHLLNKNKTYCKWHSWKYHHHIHISILIVYLFLVISFGIIWLNNPPKTHATDPEITTTTLLSGTMPETATITVPPGGENHSEAVYDFGGVYNVTSLQVSCTVSPPTKNTPEWPVGYTFFLSTDNVSYSAVYNSGGSPFSSLHCDENNTFASTTARYAKWRVGANSASLGSTPSAGTYAETLSNPHLYGTSLGPTVSITTPADNDTGDDPSDIYYTNTTPQTSSGTATPVAPATISTVDGNLSSAVTDATSWTASDIALSPGSNTWTVTATDSSGYTSNASRTIWLDQTNPIISANTPSCSITNSVAVTGTASDSQTNDSGLKTTNPITYTVDGGSTQNASGSTSWTATASSLTEGTHTVAITATDKASNTASESETVTYDPTDPTVAITSSSTNTNNSSYTFTGTASDATSGLGSVNAGSGTTGTTTWSRSVSLAEGDNVLSVTATDNCGNTASDSITVTLDTTDPTAEITSAATSSTASYTISGTATDTGGTGIASVSVSGASSGNGTATGTTSWSKTVTLAEGANTLTITATDNVANTGTDTLSITYTPSEEEPPPTTVPSTSSTSSTSTTSVSNETVPTTTTSVDSTPPSKPSELSLTTANLQAKVSWSNPNDSDLSTIILYLQKESGGSISEYSTNSATASNFILENLENNVTYNFWLKAKDASGNLSTSTETLIFTGGSEQNYSTPKSLTPSLSISQTNGGAITSKLFAGIVGLSTNHNDRSAILVVNNSKLEFYTVTPQANLSTPSIIATLKSPPNTKQTVTMDNNLLIDYYNNSWHIFYTDQNILYTTNSQDSLGKTFKTPIKISDNIADWKIRLVKNNERPIISALTSDRKSIKVFTSDDFSGWNSNTLITSKRIIDGFDVFKTNNNYLSVFQTTEAESKNLFGKIINAFKVNSTINLVEANKESVIYKGSKTSSPQIVLDSNNHPHLILWKNGFTGGIFDYIKEGNNWRENSKIVSNNSKYGFEGLPNFSSFYDNSNSSIVTVFNSPYDNKTHFAVTKDNATAVSQALNAQNYAFTPKIINFKDNNYLYIIGNSGFVYKK